MSEGRLDHDLAKQLASLVEKLTTTGSVTLDAQLLKQFKKICKTSDLYVERAFRLLMTQLSREHAEIRLSTFQIIDEIFNRSHAFRELLVSDFQNVLLLTVETDQHHHPLPPPKAAANKLKTDALKAVQQWQDKYGSAYKKLALGYKYLKTCRHVNFNDIRARTLAEQQRQEQQKQKALAAKLEKARKEFSELQKEITDTTMEAENCIELLLPKPDLLFTETDFGVGDTVQNSSIQHPHTPAEPFLSPLQQKTCASSSTCDTSSSEKYSNKSTSNESINGLSETVGNQSTNSETLSKTTNGRGKPSSASEQGNDSEKASCSNSATSGLPHTEGGNESDHDDDEDDDDEDIEAVDGEEAEELGMVQTHGLGSRKYNLQIEIGTEEVRLTETDNNRDLFRSLKDSSCLISMRYLPQVVRWLEVLSKTGGSQKEIQSMIDLKVRLENIKAKCAELHVVPDPSTEEQQSESDEDMEEVPEKEGYEPVIPAHLRAEYGLDPNPKQSVSATSGTSSKSKSLSTAGGSNPGKKQDPVVNAGPSGSSKKRTSAFWNLKELSQAASVQDPASRAANIVKLDLQDDVRPSTSRDKPSTVTSENGSEVPTLSYGLDLAYWGTPEKIEAPAVIKNDSLHRFWVPAEVEHEKSSQNDIAAVMNRTFHYTGEFVPVKWKCRAKLPNGKLCERMDRVKCPFHGRIISRDEDGCPSNPEDVTKDVEKAGPSVKQEPTDGEHHEIQPWLDAELQADIEAATGHDLGSQRTKAQDRKNKGLKGKGKGKKPKYEGLTNIKESKNTSRARLEARVFNKRALKRVASALDAADYKRVRDKFGNQFNYAFKK